MTFWISLKFKAEKKSFNQEHKFRRNDEEDLGNMCVNISRFSRPENNKSENEFRVEIVGSREMKQSDSFDCFEGSDCGIACKVDRNKTVRCRFDVGFSSSFSFGKLRVTPYLRYRRDRTLKGGWERFEFEKGPESNRFRSCSILFVFNNPLRNVGS